MTTEQVTKLEEMRIRGDGIACMATELGLSANTVKSYLRRHPLLRDETERCQCCGKPLVMTPHRRRKKFCSDVCRMKWWNSHPEAVRRQAVYSYMCLACGATFNAYGNGHRKYCSHACYIAHRYGGEQA